MAKDTLQTKIEALQASITNASGSTSTLEGLRYGLISEINDAVSNAGISWTPIPDTAGFATISTKLTEAIALIGDPTSDNAEVIANTRDEIAEELSSLADEIAETASQLAVLAG